MIKRILLGAVAVAALFSAFAARPVMADGISIDATNEGIVPQIENAVIDTANRFLSVVPMPAGWQQRHLCVISDPVDKSWCVFFPWPS